MAVIWGQEKHTERPLRYRQEWHKVQDIYGSDSEEMAVECHALSLRFAHDNNQDYITCPLARLTRNGQGNWSQDESYIPPLLRPQRTYWSGGATGYVAVAATSEVPASDGPAPGKQSAYGGLRGSGCVPVLVTQCVEQR